MAKWEIKGVVDDEPKTTQEAEQAVLDNAVEKGEITPEAAGQEADEVPKINLDKPTENAVQERETEKVSVGDEPGDSKEVDEEVRVETEESPIELVQ